MSEILQRGQWTNSTTFEKFYNKPIMQDGANEILKGNSYEIYYLKGGFKHSVLYQRRFYGMKFLNFVRARSA